MNSWITDTASKRRDKLGIIAQILEIAKDGTLKTQVMYKANLSFVQLNEYLDYMLKTGLLEKLEVNKKEVYVATEKGSEFLQKHAELAIMLDEGHESAERPRNGVKTLPRSLLKKA
ncbi:MAG: winged helix-turn-helix domain-containing protein [Candidatus Bathyarchaeota archaeon]|nr:winged helix-turn-helix domain-containing protein [Candidatus Bathyarchaeota archaeon]